MEGISSSREVLLYESASQNNLSLLHQLLREPNCNINWQNPHDRHRTALHSACANGSAQVTQVYLLQTLKIDLNVQDDDGNTPLILACSSIFFRLEMVKDLIEDQRVDVLRRNNEGESALSLAKEQVREILICWMILFGRSQEVLQDRELWERKSGETIRSLVKELAQNPLEVRQRLRMSHNLLDPGFDLWVAVNRRDPNLIRAALQIPGINVNWGDPNFGRTSFFRSCSRGIIPGLKELLADPRVEVNKESNSGCTPFYIACQNGQLEAVKLLIADPRIDINKPKSEEGRTPIWIAFAKGHTEIVKWILASKSQVVIEKHFATISLPNINHELLTKILRYRERPEEIRQKIRNEFFRNASQVFALSVLFSDEYLKVQEKQDLLSLQFSRFFRIVSSLPLELQMLLCLRAHQFTHINIPLQSRLDGFAEIARWCESKTP